MATFVLVHGACHGGWCWRHLTPILEADGHRVYAPDLTGLGERFDEATPETGLSTHVEDIIGLYEVENLNDTVLVGHSYGGMVIGPVADVLKDRISSLIYLDAHIPETGRAMIDNLLPDRRKAYEDLAAQYNGWQVAPPPIAFFGVTDPEMQHWGDAHLRPHPLKCMTEPSQTTGAWTQVARKVYIRCMADPLPHMDPFEAYAKAQNDWDTYRMSTGHDCMISDPEGLADLLLRYVAPGVQG